mmetsp:Transcript_10106/g.24908  ORF Transcript_10106/g.24908 Transcript_10106/m.24908 type:complete len:394 (+) Transcript_10106:311-1492(+)
MRTMYTCTYTVSHTHIHGYMVAYICIHGLIYIIYIYIPSHMHIYACTIPYRHTNPTLLLLPEPHPLPAHAKHVVDAAEVARGARDGAAGHEEEEGVEHAQEDGPHQQRTHLGKEEEGAQKQHPPRQRRRQAPPHHRAPHVRQGEPRLLLPRRLVPRLLVHVAQVDRVVDREANDDDARDRLGDAEVPPVVHLDRPQHPHDDHGDGYCGVEGEEEVARGEDEDDKDDGEADGEAGEEVLYKGVLHLGPGEAAAWPLQIGEEDALHPPRRPPPQPVDQLPQVLLEVVPPGVAEALGVGARHEGDAGPEDLGVVAADDLLELRLRGLARCVDIVLVHSEKGVGGDRSGCGIRRGLVPVEQVPDDAADLLPAADQPPPLARAVAPPLARVPLHRVAR